MYTPIRDYQNRFQEYQEAISEVLESGQFIMGSQVKLLEERLANYLDTDHCITTGSGTDALLAALLALDIKPDDKVATVSFSWISTAEVISLIGAIPVFIDIDPVTFNMSPTSLQTAIDDHPDIKVVIVVNLYGQIADYKKIRSIIGNRFIIEDAAQSFGAIDVRGYKSCSIPEADISCTSFFPSKPLGAFGEGGACFTKDATLAQHLRSIRNHGAEERFHSYRIGFNGRMSAIQAAVLLVKLKYFNESLDKRITHAYAYNKALHGSEMFKIPSNHNMIHTYSQYTLQVANQTVRDKLREWLLTHKVACSVFYLVPIHLQQVYLDSIAKSETVNTGLVNTEEAAKTVLSIPVFPELTSAEMDHIIEILLRFSPDE